MTHDQEARKAEAANYAGVSYDSTKGKFQAYLRVDGKKHTFGNHATARDAAIAYNAGAFAILGEDAVLNDVDPDDDVIDAGEAVTVPDPIVDEPDWKEGDPVADGELPGTPKLFGDEDLRELASIGVANLHDSVKKTDEQLFALRHLTIGRVDLIRDAEVAAGLREPEADPIPDGAQVDTGDGEDDLPATVDEGDVIPPLTDDERADFARLKTQAHDNAVALWRALAEINERKLYRENFGSFEDFTQAEFGKGRQWAYQLIDAAKVTDALSAVGVQPTSERQARELKKAAKIVSALSPDAQVTVAKFIEATTGTSKPSTSQLNAVAEVVRDIDAAGTVEDPDTGAQVLFSDLPEEKRVAIVRENVTNSTAERLARQKEHIAAKGREDAALKPGGKGSGANVSGSSWADWVMNYAAQAMTHDQEVRITVAKDPSGNPKATAQVVDRSTGEVIATGESADYLKRAVMALIEELKAGGAS